MQINQTGIDLIKRFEGLRLDAYQDVAGIWTIGYGHIKTAKPGMKITEQQAEALLRDDLKDAEKGVQSPVKVDLSDNEYSALVSLVFNIGRTAFGKSTAVKALNRNDRMAAADAIELWNKSSVGGKKVVIPGLVARRAAEKALFLAPSAAEVLASATAPVPAKGPTAPPAQTKVAGKVKGATAPTNKVKAVVATRDTGPMTRAKPIECSRVRRDGLHQSRTIQGAVTTAATGAATVGAGAGDMVGQTNTVVHQVLTYVHAYSSELLVLGGIVVVAASLWVIAARIDDWSKGYR